jgi:hypothetical protein
LLLLLWLGRDELLLLSWVLLVLMLMLVWLVGVGFVGAVGCWMLVRGGVLLDDVDDLLFVVSCCWLY